MARFSSSKFGSSSNPKTVKLALAIGLCILAAGVLAWRALSSSEPPVDPTAAQKQKEIQASIQSSTPPPAPEPEVMHRSRKGGPVNPK
jgi:hypothetical protein